MAGGMVERDGNLVLTEDTKFTSPSAASSIMLGRQSSGPADWLDESGKAYKDIQNQDEGNTTYDSVE